MIIVLGVFFFTGDVSECSVSQDDEETAQLVTLVAVISFAPQVTSLHSLCFFCWSFDMSQLSLRDAQQVSP